MAITAQDVNKLRQMTGAGMMDCKKALTEADGDFDAAVDLLRKKGQKISEKRADRTTTEGKVFAKTNDGNSQAVLIALNCETDFVAKNEEFVSLGESILNLADDKSTVEELTTAALADGRSVQEHITDFMGKIGEKIEISAFEKMDGDTVVPYIHSNAKLGVLVALSGASGDNVVEIGKDVAMQIAAMNPVAVDEAGVSQETKDREMAIGREQAIAEGKPENIVDKIAEGKLKRYYKDNTLVHQSFVKDGSKTVSQVLKDIDQNLTVGDFKRISIG